MGRKWKRAELIVKLVAATAGAALAAAQTAEILTHVHW